MPFEDDDLDQDDEHKNLEEAVKRYEKAAGLLSVLALHMPFIREVMTFCWVASEYCTLFAFWNDEAQLIYMVKQVLQLLGVTRPDSPKNTCSCLDCTIPS